MFVNRTSVLLVLLAAGLVSCGGDDAGGGGDETGSSSGTSATSGSSGAQQTSTSSNETGTSGEPSTSTSVDSTASTSETGSDASSSGENPFGVDCDDGGLPVRVEGGAEYATVSEGVTATPPGSTLWICPGEYTEDASIQIQRDLTIIGAGPDVVTLTAAVGLDRVFLVRDASITLEGVSIVGAGFGIDVGYETNEPRITTLRNLRVAQSRQAGIYVFQNGVDLENAQAVFEGVVVEGVVAEGDTPAIGGVALYGIQASFLDSSIRDNVTRSGGFEVQDSQVDFEGGEVVRNEALFPNGGGVRLLTDTTPLPFTITESNWGANAEQENTPNDVDCGSGVSNDVGWLGDPANAVCGTDIDGCCTPK